MESSNSRIYEIKKYIDYFLETKGFTSDIEVNAVSELACRAAGNARGSGRGPALILHGIMPRSGSVYVGELLRRHPDLYAFPHQLWEFPALQLAADIRKLQEAFILGYKPNSDKIAADELLPLIGASFIAYLHEPVPPQQRLLVKMPGVKYLSNFFSMFPHENLLILVRDGRDLVHSTLKTWPQLNFVQVCLRWNRSAKMVLHTVEHLKKTRDDGYWLCKYEDALAEPETFIRNVCQNFNLDEAIYPFEQIDKIRVIGSSKLEQANQEKVTWQHLQRPTNFRPVEYWKKWSAVKKHIFKIIAGRSLIDLGYCEDLNW
jgi:protein-tyrosine sulfotransferase